MHVRVCIYVHIYVYTYIRNPPAPVGAKGRVFPEQQVALARGGALYYAGKTHGTFIKHCNLQHLGPRQSPPLFGPRTLRQRLRHKKCRF